MKFYLYLISILFIVQINIVHAKSYFVSNEGSDQNNGDFNAPFKTIKFSINNLNQGDSLFIRKGIYYLGEKIKIKSNTFICAYNNEKVEIHGTEIKQNWTAISENIWKCNNNDSIIQIFINGRPYFQATYPNIIEGMIALEKGVFAVAYPNKEVHINGLNQFKNLEGSRVLGLHGKGLVSLNGKISFQDGEKVIIENDAFYWGEPFRKEYLDTGKVFVVGSKQFLDSEKEWFWENGDLFLFSNENPNNLLIESRTTYYTLEMQNINNTTIKDISFFAVNIDLSNSTQCSIIQCLIKYPTPFFHFPDGFERFKYLIDEKNQLYFDNPKNWTGKGVTISGSNNKIEKCSIAHSWGDGLTVWGDNHTIINNEIFDCDWIANDCAPLSITGKGHLIQNNTIHTAGRSVLVHRKIENSKILYNHLYNAGIHCEDLGITYCYDTDGKNTEIAYNYIHDNKSRKTGAAIYLDNGNSNFNIHHNIVTNSLVGININKTTENIKLWNNTLYNNIYSMGSWGSDDSKTINLITFNNITNTNKKAIWNYNSFYGTKMDSNHVYFDNNIFDDPENHNFSLKKYSYPIDKGITNEYTLPFKGKAPDLGAIESDSDPIEYGASIIIENDQHYPPKAPLKLKLINNTPTATVLTWEYPFNYIDSFYLERKISGDTFKIIAKLPSSTLNYNDSSQPPGEYRYRVKAVNQYGISEPSNSIEIFVPKYDNSLFLDAENNDLQFGNSIAGDLVINSDHSDWICYKEIDFGIGIYDACLLNMAVPCEQAWQEVQIRIDRPMGRMIGNLITTNTGGWDKFEYRTIPIEKTTGKHDVYIRFEGEQGIGIFDWFNLFDSKGTVIESLPNANKCPKPKNPSRIIAVTIFPNPSSEEVSVSVENIEESIISIRLISTQGKTLLTMIEKNQLPGTQEFYLHDKMNISNLEKGLYFVEVTITGKRVIQSKSYKFMKN